MSEVKRILIGGFTTETGGMESYIMNLYEHINRDVLQFDFVNNLSGDIAFADKIKKMGGRIFNVPMIRNGATEHFRAMDSLFKNNKYEALYYQANRKLKNADVFKYAKKYNVPHRILHSHNTRDLDESKINKLRVKLTEVQLKSYITDRFACSREAGEWMFPGLETVVVNNGVDSNVFDFDTTIRESLRSDNANSETKVYGTVGRICEEKNSLFLVDIFAEIHKRNKNAVFWHIGGGGLESQLKERIKTYGLEDSYILLGRISNVYDYLNAMDVLLLPSIHEGFPITLVEAQCSGLKCLISDKITKSVDITGNVNFKSLNHSAEEWAKEAELLADYERKSCKDIIVSKGYDEQSIADWFSDFILTR